LRHSRAKSAIQTFTQWATLAETINPSARTIVVCVQALLIRLQEAYNAEIVGIRFKPAGKIYFFRSETIYLKPDDNVIVETARGS
jgi:hypothetical protein